MDKPSERRLVENELLFKEANSKVQLQVKKDRRTNNIPESTELHFYCECSNFNCRERIVMSVGEYEQAHSNFKEFITLPGHENLSVERIVASRPEYIVVEKFLNPAKLKAAR